MSYPYSFGAGILDDEQDKTEHPGDDHDGKEDAHGAAEHETADDHGESDGHGESHAESDWTQQDQMDYFLGKDHLIAHVQDAPYFEIPSFDGRTTQKLEIPNPFPWTKEKPLIKIPESDFTTSATFQPTKFMVLELVAALLIGVVFISLGRKVKAGGAPKGRLWNMLEAVLVYVRSDVAVPAIGKADAGRFLPFLWTIFFFVLTLNLIGMIPAVGAPTASISVTAALALYVFCLVLFTGMKKMGVAGFWLAQAPHIELSGPLKYILIPMIWAIEVFGLFIKHVVLAVRLFANMFAGHLVLAVFVAFIGVAWTSLLLSIGVVPAVIGASVAISVLELLVAFIQAYVFTFLTALFIGAAIHPH